MECCFTKVSLWFWGFDPFYLDDKIFAHYPEFRLLREKLQEMGLSINTYDVLPPSEADLTIYCNFPDVFDQSNLPGKSILMLYECSVIHPHSWKKSSLDVVDRVLTYENTLVDNKKKFEFQMWPQFFRGRPLVGLVEKKFTQKEKLFALIAGNKYSKTRGELYSLRRKVIRWFEMNHFDDFDLFGRGWAKGEYLEFGLFKKILNRLGIRQKHIVLPFASFVSEIPGGPGSAEKLKVLSEYKFCICFENAQVPGYITEKIFDCFFSSCVPIYLGAPDIGRYVDKDCFIDYRDFESLQALYSYVCTIDEETYNQYLLNARKYLSGKKAQIFSYEAFANNLAVHIEEVING